LSKDGVDVFYFPILGCRMLVHRNIQNASVNSLG